MLEVFGLSNGAVHGKVICIARKELHHLVHPESVKQGLEKPPREEGEQCRGEFAALFNARGCLNLCSVTLGLDPVAGGLVKGLN